jgi:glutathione synthase/RimK-type ligase-like ATP-grasp enzyme
MRVAVLVPAPGFHEAWDWAYDVEAGVLERAGVSVEPRHWTDPGDLSEFDLVMPLVAWGYHSEPARWHTLLDRLDHERVRMLNPVAVLRWNSDKRYLAELGQRGVDVIPTQIVEALDEAALASARDEFGDTLIIKPPVSAAADGTFKLGPADALPASACGKPTLIQPFLPSVAEEGEYSIMLFGGRFSHAIVKRPKAGDYRVQPHLGGTEEACEPPAGAIDLAHAALAAAPARPTYARVDMVRDSAGALAVIELELIEPALWLQHAPDGGASFGSAVVSALSQE